MAHRAAMKPVQPFQVPPVPPWQSYQVLKHLRDLEENLCLLKAVKDEAEVLLSCERIPGWGNTSAPAETQPEIEILPPGSEPRGRGGTCQSGEGGGKGIVQDDDAQAKSVSHLTHLRKALEGTSVGSEERRAAVARAARSLSREVGRLLAPLDEGSDISAQGQKVDVIAKLAKKRQKVKRNRRWRSKRRQQAAIAVQKEKAAFERIDSEVDAWRAREIAKDIVKRKMENMKEIAQKKAKEDRVRQAEKQEMGLLVKKLQELRALRIQKLKKQGRFFPEEDNEFTERIRLAVEEEEKQAAAAADTNAAAAAIANASVAAMYATPAVASDILKKRVSDGLEEAQGHESAAVDKPEAKFNDFSARADASAKQRPSTDGPDLTADYHFGGLPPEFYQYFYGSNFDMGTLIEVRRSWDAFIMPGGSRIPGHWIQAPVPADTVWASYLVRPASSKRVLQVAAEDEKHSKKQRS